MKRKPFLIRCVLAGFFKGCTALFDPGMEKD
jgi:hypothetical protein